MIDKWTNCYEESWQEVIVPEAFSHPAKMSYGLLLKILSHAKEQGWIKDGEVILDLFGGIGSTGILGAYEGYQVICVELEQKFVDLAKQNFKLHENAWDKLRLPHPVILQGDSRRLCEIVEKADCIVSSPPYSESHVADKEATLMAAIGKARKIPDGAKSRGIRYGHTPGQMGSMKASNPPERRRASVDAIISSPPHSPEGLGHGGNPNKIDIEKKLHGRISGAKYGNTKGNLGNLKSGDVDCVISSPPFMLSDNRDADKSEFAHKFHGDQRYSDERASLVSKRGGDRLSKEREEARQKNVESIKNLGNIVSGGNKGLINQDTFWSAAKIIIEQCYQILKPGGYAIWVVKSFVRKGKIVDFPGDWQRLCEAVGFKTVCIHHAMLVKETEHKTLFGHTEVKIKERKSFFRRLAESKGSPKIDYEVVLCISRPALFKKG